MLKNPAVLITLALLGIVWAAAVGYCKLARPTQRQWRGPRCVGCRWVGSPYRSVFLATPFRERRDHADGWRRPGKFPVPDVCL